MATAPKSHAAGRTASAADTRSRVMQATIDCILEEGFYRASSNRIAKRAGVTWGVIQYHFGTREALLMEVFKRSMYELLDTLEHSEITGDSFETRLESFADIVWSVYRQPRFVAYEQLTLNLSHDPNTAGATLATMAELDSRIGARFDELVGEVLDRRTATVLPPRALFQILRGLAIGLALGEAVPGRRKPRRGRAADPERAVLLHALIALVSGVRGS